MAHPTNILKLSDREAIADVIYRVCLAFDTNDIKLFHSAVIKDKITINRDNEERIGLESVMQNVFNPVSALDTHHSISNIRIEHENGATTAHMVTYMLAQHHRKGEAMDPRKEGLIGGTTNSINVELDETDKLWKMTKWDMHINWISGDASIVGLPGY